MSELLELWAPIAEAPAYEVSTWGRVRRGEFEVASWPNAKGYHLVNLEVPGRPTPALRYVHRLVLEAFAGPQPPGCEADHGGPKADNALGSLEWVTHPENMARAWARGLIPRSRVRRTTCVHGHPLEQTYTLRDRHGIVRTYHRCARCRRVRARRARDRALGFRSLFDAA